MEPGTRQVTIIDELWDNEESKNRRLYDEQERGLQRENIELNDRIKRFEKQLEKDHDKELIKRVLSKQAIEFTKLLTKKDQEIEQLNEQVKQLSKSSLLESALRQSNIEKLHLEKRLLSSVSSLNSTTTTNVDVKLSMANPSSLRFTGFIRDVRTSKRNLQQTLSQPISTAPTSTNEEQSCSPGSSGSSVFFDDPINYQALQKMNEGFKTEIQRLTCSNEDNTVKLKLQFQQYDELQQAYKQLEIKYNQLSDIEKVYRKEKLLCDSYCHENEQLKEKLLYIENEINHKYSNEYNKQKQKIDLLEDDLLTLKSTQNYQQDLQMKIEHLQKDLQLSIKECETTSALNTQLRNEITNATHTNERLTEECETLRRALIAKSDEYDLKQRENEQLKTKNIDLESIIKSLQDANGLQKRLNDENETNKQELKKKQDDFEQFQKMHDTTKQEHQTTIHVLQDKIQDLERKTELQTSKYEEILLQLQSLKTQQHRVLPSSTENSPLTNNNYHNPLTIMSNSQILTRDDSAPIHSHQRLKNLNDKLARIVVAKYSYEPLRFSPNDHPEIELPLKLGEYYLIYGNIDEDGFYDGRNLEGRYGLIPSNFIELVKNPNDLPENTKHIIQKLIGNSYHHELTSSLDSDSSNMNSSIHNPIVRTPTNSNASDTTINDLSYGKNIPHPTNLHIEKLFSNSVLIAWDPPLSTIQILGYQVMLDQTLYTTIQSNERTHVLIENINLNEKHHRISIQTITQLGLSRDQQCTLLLTNSKDLSYIPKDLRVDRINQTSAVISWWPASNDIIHKLFVNDKEIQTIKPGTYRFKLTNLVPNTIHKIKIKAKPSITTNIQQQQLASSIEFRTTSFDESIEPPRRVQAIADLQSNTVRVSWEPISTARGYRILIDGRQILDITNPLNDQTVINSNILHHGRFLTIRTLNDNGGESRDSIPIDIDDILKKTSYSSSTISSEPSIPIISSTLLKSTTNGKEISKSLTRSLESPSTISSINTDISQIELNSTIPKTISHNKSAFKQYDNSDSNRIRTTINENFNINKSTLSGEQRSIPLTTNKTLRLQRSSAINNHLLDKTNTPPRLFVALFDYDPQAMSPNQNSDEELPFKQGQIIKIYGNQDADGFYIGQTENGQTGYVPSNMVSEVEVSDSENQSTITTVSTKHRTSSLSTPKSPKSIKKMIALFDYNPNEHSPNANSKDELSFHSGDIIYVHGNIHDDGFYSGELENGKKGFVPSNYLKEISNENTIEKSTESNEKQETSTNVNNNNNETTTNVNNNNEATTNINNTNETTTNVNNNNEATTNVNNNSDATTNINNNNETTTTTTTTEQTAEQPPAPSTEPPKAGFFDRFKNTFSWNLNEPI
ncbi:unnamed protein product [Rotaria sordida]|uniref:SH3 domain-containing protein n=1 Tax=Rotaria sordida TaxID=392033 RepID=A0A818ZUN2_9BILA|nr:unnamed protein product [Rotaria sordida]